MTLELLLMLDMCGTVLGARFRAGSAGPDASAESLKKTRDPCYECLGYANSPKSGQLGDLSGLR